MQSEMHLARNFLIERLHTAAGVVAIHHDGSDYVMADIWTGERIIIYIAETAISLHEIKSLLESHTKSGWYTLFVFWSDMLLPGNGELFLPQDWMQGLLPLYQDKIYGFDVYGKNEVVLFPVYFMLDRIR